MSKAWCALMIFSDGKDGSEILPLTNMSNEMKSGWMQFTTTKAMPKVGRNLCSRWWRLRMAFWDHRITRRDRAGNSAHGVSLLVCERTVS